MYKNYNIFINVILLILIILILNYFLKNNKKLEKYTSETPQGLIISSVDSLINDMNTIKNEHNINQSNLQNIITKTQDVIDQIKKKITELETLIGNDEEISQLQTTINTLTQNISNLEQMILNLNNNKNNNSQTQRELQSEINNLINLNNFLDEHPRYNGEIIELFSNNNNNIQVINTNDSTITDSNKFNINTNNVKIKIGTKYLKKLSNPEFVHKNDTNTITDSDTVPDIPEISWLNIMGYHKVQEITTGNIISNPNGESICAFAVWPNWNSTWNNMNETNLPTEIKLKNSDGIILFEKKIIPIQKLLGTDDGKDITEDLKNLANPYPLIFNGINYLDYLPSYIQAKIKSKNNYNGFIVNYWNHIYHSNATNEDRCQVYFLSSNSTSREFKIEHDGSISRCAILKNDKDNNNCNSVSITIGRQCTAYIPHGEFNVNGDTKSYTPLTNPKPVNFTLTERLYHFGGSFTNDARHKVNGQWCDSNVRIHSMDLPGYNLFSDTVTSRRQNLINQTKKHWRLSPNRNSRETPVFAWGRTTYYYKILNYHNAIRGLAGDYISYLSSIKTELIDSTNYNNYLNYDNNNNKIEYIKITSKYKKYNFSLTDSLSDATDFKLECNSDCNIQPNIFRTGRTYKIKTASGDKYVMDDLNDIISDDSQDKLTQLPIETTYHTIDEISSSNNYILNVP